MEIPVGVWMMHRISGTIFKITKVHPLYCETIDLEPLGKGGVNRFILEHDLRHRRYVTDVPGKD